MLMLVLGSFYDAAHGGHDAADDAIHASYSAHDDDDDDDAHYDSGHDDHHDAGYAHEQVD